MKKVKSVTCPKIHHNDEQRNNKALTDAKKTKRMILTECIEQFNLHL